MPKYDSHIFHSNFQCDITLLLCSAHSYKQIKLRLVIVLSADLLMSALTLLFRFVCQIGYTILVMWAGSEPMNSCGDRKEYHCAVDLSLSLHQHYSPPKIDISQTGDFVIKLKSNCYESKS